MMDGLQPLIPGKVASLQATDPAQLFFIRMRVTLRAGTSILNNHNPSALCHSCVLKQTSLPGCDLLGESVLP